MWDHQSNIIKSVSPIQNIWRKCACSIQEPPWYFLHSSDERMFDVDYPRWLWWCGVVVSVVVGRILWTMIPAAQCSWQVYGLVKLLSHKCLLLLWCCDHYYWEADRRLGWHLVVAFRICQPIAVMGGSCWFQYCWQPFAVCGGNWLLHFGYVGQLPLWVADVGSVIVGIHLPFGWQLVVIVRQLSSDCRCGWQMLLLLVCSRFPRFCVCVFFFCFFLVVVFRSASITTMILSLFLCHMATLGDGIPGWKVGADSI